MNMHTNTSSHEASPDDRDRSRTDTTSFDWNDIEKRSWRVELSPDAIRFQSGTDTTEIPKNSWGNDIYLAGHGDGQMVRVETFQRTIKFLVAREEAAPLIAHLGIPKSADKRVVTDAVEPTASQQLLWPKVSPLAIGALICSALVFIPVLGMGAELATIALLILHRRTVRRATAWRHSRAICAIACVFLVTGSIVSALATWCMRMPLEGTTATSRLLTGGAGGEPTWGLIVGGLVVVLLALTVHEAAHAITAWWLGDGLAKSLGRVTLNPLAHIDPFGTILLPLILAWAGGVVFGYARPVPVRVETLPRYRRAHILISLAGPGSNLLLASASLMLLMALGCIVRLGYPNADVVNLTTFDFLVPVTASGFGLAPAFGAACTVLKLSFLINVVLAMFNLIPIPPLDGSWVLEHLFPRQLGGLYAKIRPYGFLIFLGAIYAGLFEYLFIPVRAVLAPGLTLLQRATGM